MADPLSNPVDHLNPPDPLGKSVDHLNPKQGAPSTPPKDGSSWVPPFLRRRGAAPVAAGRGGRARRKGAGAGEEETPAAAGQASEPPEDRRKTRMLVPKALRTLDDDRRAHASRELSETLVWTTIKSFVGYCLFLLVFTIFAFSTRSSSDYWANEGMKQLFVEGPFFFDERVTHEKTLNDVHFVPQFFAWLEGPFLERIHTPELGSPPRYLHGYNRIIGPVRLRQLRMQPGTCTVPPMFNSLIDECYAPYWILSQSEAPFGPPEAPMLWTYSTRDELDGLLANGRFATYSGGGYVVDLPLNKTEASGVVGGLKQNGWIDRATRAVFVDFSAYNANTETFLSVRILFEFLPTGGIMPYPILRVLHPLTYTSSSDIFRAAFEFIFATITLFYLITEGRELRNARRARTLSVYWGNKWNILDWIVALLSVAVIVLRLYVFVYILEIRRRIEAMQADDEYVNLQPVMFQLQQVQNLNSINALLLFLKVFKYLAVIPQMDLLFGTLQVAGLELVLFSVLFSIVILGFGMAFYMAFGLEVHGYRSVSASLISLFQLVLGIFDYDELWNANRVLAPVLFGCFSVLVILILMNIFLAIINDAFAVVSERQKQAKSLTGIFRALFYKKVLHRQFDAMLSDIEDTAAFKSSKELMEKIDMNGDAYLDAGELEELLRQTRLFEHFTVKELILRFDADGDGKLSGDEVRKMNDALLRKRRQVDMQLAAQLSPRTRSKIATIFGSHQVREESADEDEPQDGVLYTRELRASIEEMGYQINEEQLDKLLTEFDADNSSALDLLEFTALMARMLGYRELPEEQFKLLRKVFHYVDSDSDGTITPAELRAVVERFGIKMVASQLEQYIKEFDADGDGKINVTEFCNLMSKLHGRLGITTNPTMVAKDLQLTVRKLEQLVTTNNMKTSEALEALVSEAKVDAPSFQAETAAARSAHASSADAFNRGVAMAATAAAAAAASAAQRLAAQLAQQQKGSAAGAPSAAMGRRGSARADGDASGEAGGEAERSVEAVAVGMVGGTSTRTNSHRDESQRDRSRASPQAPSPDRRRDRRRHREGDHSGRTRGTSRDHVRGGGGTSAKSKPGRSKRGGGGFEADDLLTRGVAASAVSDAKLERPADVRVPDDAVSPTRKSPKSPRSREKMVNELLNERNARRGEKERGGRGGRQAHSRSPLQGSPVQGSPGNTLIC